MTTNQTNFEDSWDEFAVNERRESNKPPTIHRRGIISLDIGRAFDGVLKLNGALESIKTAIKLPKSSKVCSSCGDLKSDVLGLPLSCIEDSASECGTCMILWSGILLARSRWQNKSSSMSHFRVDIYPRGHLPVRIVLDWDIPEDGYLGQTQTALVLDYSSKRREDEVESVLPWFGFLEMPEGDYLQQESVARLAGYLNNCMKYHPACNNNQFNPRSVPKRLLALNRMDGSITIKLEETQGKQVQFIALSHCWGKFQIIKTTQENYYDHLSNIIFTSLSKTFQDAVKLTLDLGQKYIWIDSLCIIQNVPHDWAIEAAKMGDIYENAMLVIAASSAADGSVGLNRIESMVYPLTITNGPEELGTIIIRRPFDHTGYLGSYDSTLGINLYNGKALNPIETRAWTLQEEIHARRLVKFTAREMIYQCLEHRQCECGEIDVSLSGRIWGVKKNVRLEKNKYHPKKSPKIWFDVLSAFQERNITFEIDRLPALSSTAQRLFHDSKHYIAGLPREDLPRYLLWGRLFPDAVPQPRPKEYMAPTWSWASISDKFEPSIAALPVPGDGLDNLVPKIWTSRLSAGIPVRVEDIKVEYASTDEFGKLKSAELTVIGLVCEAYLKKQESGNKYLLRSSLENWVITSGVPTQTSNISLDVDIHDASASDYVEKNESLLLLFFQTKSLTQICLYALVLRKQGDKFARIGIAYDLHRDWAKTRTCRMESICII